MASYSIVLFHSLNQATEKKYNEILKVAIENSISDLQVDLSNSTDSRLQKYAKKGPRCPCMIIFKDGHKVTSRHGKYNDAEVINWIKNVIGG